MALPIAGSDGHAYLAIWPDRYEWIADKADAFATNAPMIVQRCLIRGRRYGSEWTVRAAEGM